MRNIFPRSFTIEEKSFGRFISLFVDDLRLSLGIRIYSGFQSCAETTQKRRKEMRAFRVVMVAVAVLLIFLTTALVGSAGAAEPEPRATSPCPGDYVSGNTMFTYVVGRDGECHPYLVFSETRRRLQAAYPGYIYPETPQRRSLGGWEEQTPFGVWYPIPGRYALP